MRLAVLAASSFALSIMPLCAQSGGNDLREEIRRIVREEIRAALKELHSTPAEYFTKGEDGLPSKLVQVVPVQKVEADGDTEPVRVHVFDVTGKPVETKVVTKGTAKTGLGGDVHVVVDDGEGVTKTTAVVVSPEQRKRTFTIDTSKGTPIEKIEFKIAPGTAAVVKGEAECCEEVAKAVAECCEAAEKCCEATEACREENGEAKGEIVVIDDVTSAKQAKKAAKKERKKAKKIKQANGAK